LIPIGLLMAKDRLSRKLVVILHADVVGSTSLVQKDETLAHQRIQAVFNDFSKTIETYGGLAHEVRGDALVAEFNRASDAVIAAIAYQDLNEASNASIDDDIKPQLRIGISLGEVVIADNTITGAGVVISQRLEQLAEPGGVIVQGAVSETVPGRLPFEFENLGEQLLKGFEHPVRAYSVRLKPGEKIPPSEKDLGNELAGATETRATDKPSIIVMPFTNHCAEEGKSYICEGITEDIRIGLCRFRELFVIARGSSLLLSDEHLDASEVAERAGVRHVLQGSVRIVGDRVRVTAELVDGKTGGAIWAETYDRILHDVFEVQDDVTQQIVSTLARRIEQASRVNALKKPIDDLTVYDLLLRARHCFPEWNGTKEEILQARELYERAAELESNCAAAYSGIAGTYNAEYLSEWAIDRELAGERTFEFSRKALSLDDCDSNAHLVLACAYRDIESNLDLAVMHLNKAISANPNNYTNYCCKCGLMIITGDFDESIACAQKAMIRNPLLPDSCLCGIGFAEYLSGRYEQAINSFGEMLNPDALIDAYIAACYAQLGRKDEALSAAATFRKKNTASPAISDERKPESWCRHLFDYWHFQQEILDRFVEGLRKATIVD
jgi:adenylate cyclase